MATLLYTFKSSDILALSRKNISSKLNGSRLSSGSKLYNGNTLVFTCSAGYKYDLSKSKPAMTLTSDYGDESATTTYSAGDTVATGVFNLPFDYPEAFDNFVFNASVIEATASDPIYTIKQDDLNQFAADHVDLYVAGVKQALGSVIKPGDIMEFRSVGDLWLIDSILWSGADPNEGPVEIAFDVSPDSKSATATATKWFSDETYQSEWEIKAHQETPAVNASYNNLYVIDADIMSAVNAQRIVTYLDESGSKTVYDYGEYILGLINLPFGVDASMILEKEAIRLADRKLSVSANKLSSDLIKVDLGSISVPHVNNDSLDYVGVTAKLHLPHLDPINIELEYVIGQTISVEYLINAYSGQTTVNISSSAVGGVINQTSVDMGWKIPYKNTSIGSSVENNNVKLGGDNGVIVPFIELESTDLILPKGFYTIPVQEEGQLNGYKGYATVDNIEITGVIKSRELDMLKNALSNGVIVK